MQSDQRAESSCAVTDDGNMPLKPGQTYITHNTTYTGVARIHHETDEQTIMSNNNIVHRNDSEIHAHEQLFKKELTQLEQTKRSLQRSMLAYSKRMKEISLQRNVSFTEGTSVHSERKLNIRGKPPLGRMRMSNNHVIPDTAGSSALNIQSRVTPERNNMRIRKYQTRQHQRSNDVGRRVEFMPSTGRKRKLRHLFKDSKRSGSDSEYSDVSTRDDGSPELECDKKPTVIIVSSSHMANSKDNISESRTFKSPVVLPNRLSLSPHTTTETGTASDVTWSDDSYLKISPFPNIPSQEYARNELGLMSETDKHLLVPTLEKKLRRKLNEHNLKPQKKWSPIVKDKSPSKSVEFVTRRKNSISSERSPPKEVSARRQVNKDVPKLNPNLVVHHYFKYSDAIHSCVTQTVVSPNLLETRRDSVHGNITHETKRGVFELPNFKYENLDNKALPANINGLRRQKSTNATILAGPITPDVVITDFTPDLSDVSSDIYKKYDVIKPALKKDAPYLIDATDHKTVQFDIPNKETPPI